MQLKFFCIDGVVIVYLTNSTKRRKQTKLLVVVMFSVCLLNCIVFFIYFQVLKANKERQRLSRLQKREIGLATMLLCVVIVFFLCNLLPLVINIIETFNIDIDLNLMINTSNLLVTINSSVNFIIYVIFGEKFKRLFLVLFCNNTFFGGHSGRDSPDGATHEDSFMSNGGGAGERFSLRLHRQNTNISRNGTSLIRHNTTNSCCNNGSSGATTTKTDKRLSSMKYRSSSPGPCVYYPANQRLTKEISATYTTQTSIPGNE